MNFLHWDWYGFIQITLKHHCIYSQLILSFFFCSYFSFFFLSFSSSRSLLKKKKITPSFNCLLFHLHTTFLCNKYKGYFARSYSFHILYCWSAHTCTSYAADLSTFVYLMLQIYQHLYDAVLPILVYHDYLSCLHLGLKYNATSGIWLYTVSHAAYLHHKQNLYLANVIHGHVSNFISLTVHMYYSCSL